MLLTVSILALLKIISDVSDRRKTLAQVFWENIMVKYTVGDEEEANAEGSHDADAGGGFVDFSGGGTTARRAPRLQCHLHQGELLPPGIIKKYTVDGEEEVIIVFFLCLANCHCWSHGKDSFNGGRSLACDGEFGQS